MGLTNTFSLKFRGDLKNLTITINYCRMLLKGLKIIMYIEDIFFMDKIFEIEKDISLHYNKPVTNLSYWNPSDVYTGLMLETLTPQSLTDIFQYVYTYDIPIKTRNAIIEKLTGKFDNTQMCMILPNSTLSIINIVNYLKLNNYRRLLILQPSYFSIEEACKIADFEIVKIPFNLDYTLPSEILNADELDAIWITSPIYSTNLILDKSIIYEINKLTANNRLVIIDESLNINGFETIRYLKQNKYLFGIYSPHKSLFFNSFKFSVIICDKSNDDFLEQWVDVIGGSLPGSCISAIKHFLSPNYDLCVQKAKNWFEQSNLIIMEIIKKYPFVSIDTEQSIGAYVTINIPDIPLESLEFIKVMINETLVSIIPGFLNGNPNCSFRINLSLNHHVIANSLTSLLEFISRQKY